MWVWAASGPTGVSPAASLTHQGIVLIPQREPSVLPHPNLCASTTYIQSSSKTSTTRKPIASAPSARPSEAVGTNHGPEDTPSMAGAARGIIVAAESRTAHHKPASRGSIFAGSSSFQIVALSEPGSCCNSAFFFAFCFEEQSC